MISKNLHCLAFIVSCVTAWELPMFDETKLLSKVLPRVPTFPELAQTNGLQCEEHNVTTSDGYILRLYRIPGDIRRPVLLLHGILDSANGFILRGNGSLVFTLAALGYDIWIGNNRGNRYSRHHISLDPNTDVQFWDFSFHELGCIDLPTMIDFILEQTNQTQLSAVGHSEGNTVFYVMGSKLPEYNKKIKVLAALAPIAYLSHAEALVQVLIKLAPELNALATTINYQEIIGMNSDLKSLIREVCDTPVAGYALCSEVAWLLVGPDPPQCESEFFPTLIAHFPAGTSRKNLVHFSQVANRKEFAEYDYGTGKNMELYGSDVPPAYNLSKITFDLVMYCGANDFISTPEDVSTLRSQLTNDVVYQEMEYPKWNHLDHLYGKYMTKYLFPSLTDLLSKYN